MTERVLYFDCFSGVAGDMTLGALIDLGLDVDKLNAALAGLGLEGWSLDVSVSRKMGLRAVQVHVTINGEIEGPAATAPNEVAAGHSHHADHGHRSYREIVRIIEGASFPEAVEARALQAFEVLADAEARAHGIPIEDVHFHEVGAIDSIVDICGVAFGLHALGIDRIESAPLPLGRGFINTAHGRIPLPAPATLEVVKGLPVVDSGLERELVTPTGAAFLKAWGAHFGAIPNFTVDAVGHGAGNADFPDRPNILRLIMGTRDVQQQAFELLETNLDDLTPELAGYLMESLFDAGALDVWITPIQMKKNRPGFMVSALVDCAQKGKIESVLLAESSALGIRHRPVDRTTLKRGTTEVETPWGPVPVKVAERDGCIINIAPEFEPCAALARQTGVPLKIIFQHAVSAYYAEHD